MPKGNHDNKAHIFTSWAFNHALTFEVRERPCDLLLRGGGETFFDSLKKGSRVTRLSPFSPVNFKSKVKI